MADHFEVTQTDLGDKTFSSYAIGLALCLLLTFASFGIVYTHAFTTTHLYIALTVLAVAQLFVQVTCFLRVNASAEGRWTLMSFLFTIFVILVLVFGSLWIMYNLNYNMMH